MNKKSLTKILFIYFVMVVTFMTMMIMVCMIPQKWIENNVRESMEILSDEGRFPLTLNNILWGRDNITDGTMYNIAISGYDLNPVDEAISNPWSYVAGTKAHTADYGLIALNTKDNTIERQSYGRYWHGYQIPLRISSIFLTIKGQRVFHSIFLWTLFIAITILLWKQYGAYVASGWFISLVTLGFPVVPLSLQYVACYYITFAAVLLFLCKHQYSSKFIVFYIIGGFTSFMDFLTVPLITLCIPLIISFIINHRNDNRFIIKSIVFWFAGYGSIWVTKWIIQYLFMGDIAINSVINAGEAHTIIPFLPNGLTHKYFLITVSLLLISLISTLTIYLLNRKKGIIVNQLFMVSLIPFIWYFIFLGHNICHIWFTYRTLTVPVLCCWLIIFAKKLSYKS